MENILLVSEKTIKSVTLINDNVDPAYLLPAIRISQDIDLDTIIGPVLNKKIQLLVGSGDISKEQYKKYKYLLDNYITDYLCWQVMVAVQINVNFKITNSGTIQNLDDKKNAVDYQSGKNLMAQYEKYANAYAMKLKNYLKAHCNDYPEYMKCENFESEEDPMLCSIYLDTRCKTTYIGK